MNDKTGSGGWVDAGWDDADDADFDDGDFEDADDFDPAELDPAEFDPAELGAVAVAGGVAGGGDDADSTAASAGAAAGVLPGFVDSPAGQPVLAVVGRPNVGKSTLVNRILGSRQAVVQDVPGVTRDRVAYDANWRGRTFTLVDTGGWEARAQGLSAQIAEQAKMAVELADAVLFVVDARVGATDEDEAVARVLRRAGKPVILAANKVDDQKSEADAMSLWSLGLGEPFPVSALHGRGSGDLLDLILEALPEAPPERIGISSGPRRVALIGRPNVGQVQPAEQARGGEPGGGLPRWPVRLATRSTRSSSWAASHGGSSTRPASSGGSGRARAPTTTRRCAPPRRWTGPRSPSC